MKSANSSGIILLRFVFPSGKDSISSIASLNALTLSIDDLACR